MSQPELSRADIDAFVSAAAAELEGEWLLVGGGAAALWFAQSRVTADIDLVGLRGTMDERLRLMDLASAHGLAVEAVNSAADFFVRRIPGWQDEMEVLRSGPRATIYRPSPTLFLLLKLRRLSEQDLTDCRALLSFLDALRKEDTPEVDVDRVLAALAALPPTEDEALRRRREALEGALRAVDAA